MSRTIVRAFRFVAAPSLCPVSTDASEASAGGDDEAPQIDYRPIREAARTAITWLLGIARSRASEPDDQAAIDRVERATLATLDGVPRCCRPAELRASQEDVLVVAAILIETFSIDFRIPGLDQIFGALYSNLEWILPSIVVDRPPPTTVGHTGHAMQRHGDLVRAAQSLAAQLVRGPSVAHGADDERTAPRRFPR